MTIDNNITQRDIRIKKVNNEDGTSRICAATTKLGDICANNSGFRTNHPGMGRCWAHENTEDGKEIKYYTKLSIPAIQERLNDFATDKDILNLSGEIGLIRSMLELYNKYFIVAQTSITLQDNNVEGSEVLPVNPFEGMGINDLTLNVSRATQTLGKLVKTQFDIESSRKFLIHINIFYSIIRTMADIINDEVEDIEIKKAIMLKFAQISLPSPDI